MENRISGRYGEVEIKFVERKYIVKARIRNYNYYVETDDREYAIGTFTRLAGKVGAIIERPELIKVEITKRRKIIAHIGKWLRLGDGVNHAIFVSTITPYGREEDTYIPANGVVRSFVIDLTK